jgi:hypothetical protein
MANARVGEVDAEGRIHFARMLVPKMAKNGFNSVPRVRVILRRLGSEWKSGTSANTKRGNKNHFTPFSEQACALESGGVVFE